MAATVKIIPFATSEASLRGGLRRGGRVGGVDRALPPAARRRRLDAAAGAEAERRQQDARRSGGAAGAGAGAHRRGASLPARDAALAEALRALGERCDALIVFGASAITDRRDVIPAALEAAGGRIEHFGMPVDPGNLLLYGELDGKPVIGAPGCARSPKENGFDWVLGRVLAGVPVRRADIQAMGVGGLLMEIESRPQPRKPDE